MHGLDASPAVAVHLTRTGWPWRVGRHVGRTIYVQVSEDPSQRDLLIGVMDSAELAQLVVDLVNAHERPPS